MAPSREERFTGCLLGLAVGDALGAHFEGRSPKSLAEEYPSADELIRDPPSGEWWYTDDTEMAIGVAESLIACRRIAQDDLCRRFAENYSPDRGYGPGTRAILEAILAGNDHRFLAAEFMPGGSFGNGAAMRVAPVGLAFGGDVHKTWKQARLSALPTHVHPLGIEGAQLIALAVALASGDGEFSRDAFFAPLTERAQDIEFASPLRRAAKIEEPRDLALFGNGVAAVDSVVTAIASFALTPGNYCATIANVILLGGDTDTMAAMAGAISGAHLGIEAIPAHFLDALEDGPRGRTYLEDLALGLHAAFGE